MTEDERVAHAQISLALVTAIDELGIHTLDDPVSVEALRERILPTIRAVGMDDLTAADVDRVLSLACTDTARALRLRGHLIDIVTRVEEAEEEIKNLRDDDSVTDEEMYAMMARVVRLWNTALTLAEKWPRSLRDHPSVAFAKPDSSTRQYVAKLQEILDVATRGIQQRKQDSAALSRDIRLTMRRIHRDANAALAASQGPPKCSSCGKRERKFDDLCGRCADAAGVRPHGRIGTA